MYSIDEVKRTRQPSVIYAMDQEGNTLNGDIPLTMMSDLVPQDSVVYFKYREDIDVISKNGKGNGPFYDFTRFCKRSLPEYEDARQKNTFVSNLLEKYANENGIRFFHYHKNQSHPTFYHHSDKRFVNIICNKFRGIKRAAKQKIASVATAPGVILVDTPPEHSPVSAHSFAPDKSTESVRNQLHLPPVYSYSTSDDAMTDQDYYNEPSDLSSTVELVDAKKLNEFGNFDILDQEELNASTHSPKCDGVAATRQESESESFYASNIDLDNDVAVPNAGALQYNRQNNWVLLLSPDAQAMNVCSDPRSAMSKQEHHEDFVNKLDSFKFDLNCVDQLPLDAQVINFSSDSTNSLMRMDIGSADDDMLDILGDPMDVDVWLDKSLDI